MMMVIMMAMRTRESFMEIETLIEALMAMM